MIMPTCASTTTRLEAARQALVKPTMKRIKLLQKYIIVLSAFLLCSGCFPYQYTTKPGVSGTVLDADTRKEIHGANVTLTTYSFPQNKENIETTTTQMDGTFVIQAEQKWGLYMVPLDPAPLKASISVEMEGYNQYNENFYTKTTGPAISKLKNILLEHHK